MPPRLRLAPSTAVFAAVLALALANPFCCHLLPFFQAEVVQTETAFDTVDATCAGKPKAQRADDLLVVPPPVMGLLVLTPGPLLAAPLEPPPSAGPRLGGPPRYKLLGIYRV